MSLFLGFHTQVRSKWEVSRSTLNVNLISRTFFQFSKPLAWATIFRMELSWDASEDGVSILKLDAVQITASASNVNFFIFGVLPKDNRFWSGIFKIRGFNRTVLSKKLISFELDKKGKMSSKKGKVQEAIQEKLLAERKVFLWGMVDDDSAKHVIDRLLYLDLQNNEEIQLIINSPGGYVTSGFAIYDTIKQIKSPVSTVCSGLAASMGSILLSVGKKGRRFIQPNARVMIHQPSGGARGQASNIEIQAKEIIKTKELGAKILSENCGQPFDKIMKDFDRDYWMGAEESVEYGIVDGILE